MLHIVPGFVFIVLGPLQFVTTLRTRRPWVHRRIGRVVLASGLVTAVTALAITTQMAIGGATARTATTLFGVLFLRGSAGEPARDVRRRFVLSKRHSRAFRANTESFGRPRRPPRSTIIMRLRRFMTNLLLPALLPSD
jgi:hypothetical protein